MLHEILRPLKILWIVARAVRTGVLGVLFVVGGAMVIVPPTPFEVDLLHIERDIAQVDQQLLTHRMAKVVMTLDSDALYETLAESAGTELSVEQYKFIIAKLADGTLLTPQTAEPTQIAVKEAQTPPSDFVRAQVKPIGTESILAPRTNNAKFVSARTN